MADKSNPTHKTDQQAEMAVIGTLDHFTPLKSDFLYLMQVSLLQIAKCIINAKIDLDGSINNLYKRYRSLWPVYSALRYSDNIGEENSDTSLEHYKKDPITNARTYLIDFLDLLWLNECSRCNKEHFVQNRDTKNGPLFPYLLLVLDFATQLILMQIEAGVSALSLAMQNYLPSDLLKDKHLLWATPSDYTNFYRNIQIIIKQLSNAVLGSDAHNSVIINARRKYPIREFEKSLGLFCISLINALAGKNTTNTTTIRKIRSAVFERELNTYQVPISWLVSQAGGNEQFNLIASAESPQVAEYAASFASTSVHLPDILTLDGHTQQSNITDENSQPQLNSPDKKIDPEPSDPVLSLKENIYIQNQQISEQSKNSLMERNETAIKCSWHEDEDSFALSEKSAFQASPVVKNIPKMTVEGVFSSRKRRYFTEDEITCLVEGYERFGPKWRLILDSYPFCGRSTVDLKDKIRNLKKAGLLTVIDSPTIEKD